MKCYFDRKHGCPVPEKIISGSFCLACSLREMGTSMGKSMIDKAELNGVLYKPSSEKRPEVG